MSDKTYAETQGEAPFDWWHALNNPERFRNGELEEKAGSWTSCAVGNSCAIIQRDFETGEPLDSELRKLGLLFGSDLRWEAFSSAKETLALIEARSSILIAEELAKLNSAR